MILRFLGSAAGGGVPQWNCACPNCRAAREGTQPRRTQSCVALGSGEDWLLLNCSPDIAAQIEAFAALQPHALRGTPIRGMLFTDANVDHLGGLAVLRQSGTHRFVLRSSALVREIACAQPAFAPFAHEPHRWIGVPEETPCEPAEPGDPVGTRLEVRPLAVPGTTPGYDGRRALRSAVYAYRIRERASGATLLFAPVFAAIDDALREAIAQSTLAVLDGSFFSNGELRDAGLMDKSARHLGHQPVGGADGTLAQLAGLQTRVVFTHVNNSNPMLDPGSQAARSVREAGHAIAYDGMELRL